VDPLGAGPGADRHQPHAERIPGRFEPSPAEKDRAIRLLDEGRKPLRLGDILETQRSRFQKLRCYKRLPSVPDGIRSRESEYQQVQADSISPEVSRVSDESNRAGCGQPKDDCSNVVNCSRAERQNRIADELTAVRTVWLRAGDEKALRRALLDLLRHLEQNE